MGILGSISYPDLRTDNVLNVMSNESGSVLTKVCVNPSESNVGLCFTVFFLCASALCHPLFPGDGSARNWRPFHYAAAKLAWEVGLPLCLFPPLSRNSRSQKHVAGA